MTQQKFSTWAKVAANRRPKNNIAASRARIIKGSVKWEVTVDWPFWLVMFGFFLALYVTWTLTSWLT